MTDPEQDDAALAAWLRSLSYHRVAARLEALAAENARLADLVERWKKEMQWAVDERDRLRELNDELAIIDPDMKRRGGWVCDGDTLRTGEWALSRIAELEAEVAASRRMNEGLAERINAAHDILARRAEKDGGALQAEREAILATLRLLYKEHCVSHEEANGVAMAIGCVEARAGTRDFFDEVAARLEALRAALDALARRHKYHPGLGRCECEAHRVAWRLLGAVTP